ncbi:uncharacterized protein Dana_GF19807 [Drosophila ananassae]|uniref:Uncharacterized protein n=1 Tax=Drosophila ananassae TaxID=7217 RepID=B3MFZ7_DROAN|nr:uncharacterized protein Dana_GF19807 [Drosophila ananassae]
MFVTRRTVGNMPSTLIMSFNNTIRSKSDYPMPKPRKDLKKLKSPDVTKRDPADICWMAMRRTEFKCRSDPEFSVHSFINTSKLCLADPCYDRFPAMDSIYYEPSDKLNREYQRTWKECIVKTPKRKPVCTHKPVEFKRRPRKNLSYGTCKPSAEGSRSLGLAACKRLQKSSCPKLQLPRCKPALSGKCYAGRSMLPCIRRKTKYPCYSECDKAKSPHLPPVECFCIRPQPSTCTVWNHYRMKKS